jgi:hypothetical protein
VARFLFWEEKDKRCRKSIEVRLVVARSDAVAGMSYVVMLERLWR